MRVVKPTLILASVALLAPQLPAQRGAVAEPALGAYVEVKDWPTLPPGVEMGETSAVAVDNDGHVLAFHRPGRGFEPTATELLAEPTVLEFEPDTGTLITS